MGRGSRGVASRSNAAEGDDRLLRRMCKQKPAERVRQGSVLVGSTVLESPEWRGVRLMGQAGVHLSPIAHWHAKCHRSSSRQAGTKGPPERQHDESRRARPVPVTVSRFLSPGGSLQCPWGEFRRVRERSRRESEKLEGSCNGSWIRARVETPCNGHITHAERIRPSFESYCSRASGRLPCAGCRHRRQARLRSREDVARMGLWALFRLDRSTQGAAHVLAGVFPTAPADQWRVVGW
jgi:hypothetical protein